MSDVDRGKAAAAHAAATLVEPGMIVGLGTGSTASLMVQRLGERVRHEGLDFTGVATSTETAELARSLGISLRDLDECDQLDLNIDGADEVDPAFRMIKGRGGALLREKLVSSASRRRITIIGPNKQVARLGLKMPIPVEVSPFGLRHVERRLQALGATTAVRRELDGSLYLTDGGHRIIDVAFADPDEPEVLDAKLHSVVGVFETGLFLGLCDLLIVGHDDRVETITRDA